MQQQQQPPRLQVAYGGSARAREEAQRTELFSGAAAGGAGPSSGPADYGGPPAAGDYQATMDNRQLADHAVSQHKETTASAKRSLAIVEQTKEIQATTLAALRDQGKQMQGISAGMDRLGSDLSYSERMLKFMRRCCCVGLLCACCFEPGRSEADREWRGDDADNGRYKVAPPPPAIVALQEREARERAAQSKSAKRRGGGTSGAAGGGAGGAPSPPGGGGAGYRGPSGSGLAAAGLDEQAAAVADETAQQNDYLDQISAGLDQLKAGAVAMNAELRRQEAHATEMGDDAQVLHSRLTSVNRQGFRGI